MRSKDYSPLGLLTTPKQGSSIRIDMPQKSDADWKPTAMWPAAQRAVEDFSKLPKATYEEKVEQFRRNREQKARMEKEALSSSGQPSAEK